MGWIFKNIKTLQIDHCIERRLYKGVRCVMKIFYKCHIQWMRCSAVQVLRNQYIWQSKVTNKQKVSRQEGSNESPGSDWGRKMRENEWEKREKICLSAWIKIILKRNSDVSSIKRTWTCLITCATLTKRKSYNLKRILFF